MADESMVRNLAAQAECLWPQEEPLFSRYELSGPLKILDAGCGTGEISWRLAGLYPEAGVIGVDIIEAHLELARARHTRWGERLRFENRSIYELGLPDRSFDLVVCRHVIQSIPNADRVLAELIRVTRPGGRLHVIAEDYGMIAFPTRNLDPDSLWEIAPKEFGRATGTDLFIGRNAYSIFKSLGLAGIRVDYMIVDTLRAKRETFAEIWRAWRDGYSDAIGEHTRLTADQARAHFDDMIATILDPGGYGVWFVPVLSAIVP